MRVTSGVESVAGGPFSFRSGTRTVGLVAFVLLVCAVTSFISIRTTLQADRAVHATLDANRLQDALHRMSSATWRAVALGTVDGEVRLRQARAKADFETRLAELSGDHQLNERPRAIVTGASSFVARSDQVMTLVTAGRSGDARKVAKTQMLPVYLELDAELDHVGVSLGAEADRAGVVGRAASLAIGPLAVVLVVSVMVWHHRWRRKHETAMAEWKGEARFEALVEASPIATLELDSLGRIRRWSEAAAVRLGWDEEDISGARPPIVDERGLQRLLSAVGRGETLEFDGEWRRGDGSILDIVVYSSPLRDESGRPSGAVVAVADLTQLKLLTAQLHAAQKAEAVARLADGVAHDFNNLLAVIRGNADLLAEQVALMNSQGAHVADIVEATETGERLTAQLLALSGRQAAGSGPVDVNAVVREFSRLLDQITGHNVHVVFDVTDAPAVIEGHRAHVEQMLLNLAVNARDAMPLGGTVKIATTVEPPDTDDADLSGMRAATGWVTIRVEDDGVGMDDHVKRHLFEPFFTTKKSGKGTGLGLATVHSLVIHAGGIIDVLSQPGHGTTVSLRLPLSAVQAGRRELAPDDPTKALLGETVLVVDDDAPVRSMIEAAVSGCGGHVLSVANAEEALDLIADGTSPTLVISDVHLPGISGPDLVARLQASHPAITSLLISGGAPPHGVQAPRFLAKPFGSAELTQAVHRLVSVDRR